MLTMKIVLVLSQTDERENDIIDLEVLPHPQFVQVQIKSNNLQKLSRGLENVFITFMLIWDLSTWSKHMLDNRNQLELW